MIWKRNKKEENNESRWAEKIKSLQNYEMGIENTDNTNLFLKKKKKWES